MPAHISASCLVYASVAVSTRRLDPGRIRHGQYGVCSLNYAMELLERVISPFAQRQWRFGGCCVACSDLRWAELKFVGMLWYVYCVVIVALSVGE